MSRFANRWIVVWTLCGCTENAKAPLDAALAESDSAPADSAIGSFDTLDSAVDDSVTMDADGGERCPDPDYPPRTDGCPCFRPFGPCTDVGKTCVYYQTCPPAAQVHTCKKVRPPKQGPETLEWVGIASSCDAGPG